MSRLALCCSEDRRSPQAENYKDPNPRTSGAARRRRRQRRISLRMGDAVEQKRSYITSSNHHPSDAHDDVNDNNDDDNDNDDDDDLDHRDDDATPTSTMTTTTSTTAATTRTTTATETTTEDGRMSEGEEGEEG